MNPLLDKLEAVELGRAKAVADVSQMLSPNVEAVHELATENGYLLGYRVKITLGASITLARPGEEYKRDILKTIRHQLAYELYGEIKYKTLDLLRAVHEHDFDKAITMAGEILELTE
jgi:hypothetical protein